MAKIIELKQARDWKIFHRVAHRVYKNYPLWIAPLENDIEGIFNPAKNRILDTGEATIYILLDEKNKPAGRVAAFVDHKKNKNLDYNIGGIGFFECIENQEYADALLQKAEDYLASKGVQAIDAISNFGERDKFWGILARGYDLPPLFQENYHPPYYLKFFEDRGYIRHEQVLTLSGKMSEVPYPVFEKIGGRVCKTNNLLIEDFSFPKIDAFAQDFVTVYNDAFATKAHFKPAEVGMIKKMMTDVKAILEPKLITMVYKDGKPIGFAALFPDINPILKFAKGKLNWWTIPIFMLKKRFAVMDARGVAAGVVREYQSKGILAALVYHMYPNNKHRDSFKLATVRGNNHNAMSAYGRLGAKPEKEHLTLRKPLDPAIKIETPEFYEW